MITKHSILSLILATLCLHSLVAQNRKCILLDEVNKQAIPYASVLNLTNDKYTYTNDLGFFELPIAENDSIEIQHISFKRLRITLGVSDTIYLKTQVHHLPEVAITPQKKERLKSINYNKKKKIQFGMAMNSEYAFLIENSKSIDKQIVKIEIPIKMKKGYPSDGVILLQLLEADEDNKLSNIPISELVELDVSALANNKSMSFELSKPVVFPNKDFFILLKRVVPNKMFENRKMTPAVNPFFRLSKADK